MKNKKIGSVLLALAGLALVLTGCGGPATAPTPASGDTIVQTTRLKVTTVKITSTESVVCVHEESDRAISCDWDNKITSP